MSSTEIRVIFLDRQLRLKRFTPRAKDLFNLIASDSGRPIEHVTHRLIDPELAENARTVLTSLRTVERRVATTEGRIFQVRWLPYRSIVDRIEGVVITLVDVTELRDAVEARQRSESALKVAEERLRSALATAPVTVMSFNDQLELDWAFIAGREYEQNDVGLAQVLDAARLATLRRVLEQVKADGTEARFELEMSLGGEARVFSQRVERRRRGFSVIGFDVSSLKQAERELRDADVRKDEFLATLSHELRNPLAALNVALDVARMAEGKPDELRGCLDVMHRQVDMLSTLVDELLDL